MCGEEGRGEVLQELGVVRVHGGHQAPQGHALALPGEGVLHQGLHQRPRPQTRMHHRPQIAKMSLASASDLIRDEVSSSSPLSSTSKSTATTKSLVTDQQDFSRDQQGFFKGQQGFFMGQHAVFRSVSCSNAQICT